MTQFTLDSGPLNDRAPTRPAVVIGVIGAAGLALASGSAGIVLLGSSAIQQAQFGGLARPIFAVPFAVVLVAMTSGTGALEGAKR